MTVQSLKAGAVDFLTTQFRDQQLLDAVRQAIDRDRAARHQRAGLAKLRRRYESLTQREREVMTPVVTGRSPLRSSAPDEPSLWPRWCGALLKEPSRAAHELNAISTYAGFGAVRAHERDVGGRPVELREPFAPGG